MTGASSSSRSPESRRRDDDARKTPKPGRTAYQRSIAGVLVGEMRRQGLTRYRLAERTGLSRSQVDRMLTGKHVIPVDHLRAVTDALLLCPCHVFHGLDGRRAHDAIVARRRAWQQGQLDPEGRSREEERR